jgi:hypothetical protein
LSTHGRIAHEKAVYHVPFSALSHSVHHCSLSLPPSLDVLALMIGEEKGKPKGERKNLSWMVGAL